MKNVSKSIVTLEKFAKNPKKGLPDEVFYFIGRMTPYINVDLLIKCPINGTLLTWRNDSYSGKGWHIPGGIIRFKEKIKNRIFKVAKNELDINIKSYQGPLAVNQIISNQKNRSHFISLLYSCDVDMGELNKLLEISKKNKFLRFFKNKPKKLLKWHNIYSKFI
jgi:ADP-ribose pyrophosphatase YjhB (NUDIX family)